MAAGVAECETVEADSNARDRLRSLRALIQLSKTGVVLSVFM
jgi:hypothetical protein